MGVVESRPFSAFASFNVNLLGDRSLVYIVSSFCLKDMQTLSIVLGAGLRQKLGLCLQEFVY